MPSFFICQVCTYCAARLELMTTSLLEYVGHKNRCSANSLSQRTVNKSACKYFGFGKFPFPFVMRILMQLFCFFLWDFSMLTELPCTLIPNLAVKSYYQYTVHTTLKNCLQISEKLFKMQLQRFHFCLFQTTH